MKTTFFLTEQLDEKEIKKIKYLQETKSILFEEITKWFFQQNEFPRIVSELTRKFALETESNPEEVNNAFTSIYWINNLFIEYENDP